MRTSRIVINVILYHIVCYRHRGNLWKSGEGEIIELFCCALYNCHSENAINPNEVMKLTYTEKEHLHTVASPAVIFGEGLSQDDFNLKNMISQLSRDHAPEDPSEPDEPPMEKPPEPGKEPPPKDPDEPDEPPMERPGEGPDEPPQDPKEPDKKRPRKSPRKTPKKRPPRKTGKEKYNVNGKISGRS
jgi:hypothetical protein